MVAQESRKKSTAPCREACPAGIDVPRYIRHIRNGRFDEALAVIRERIPFPSVCGYACVHPCETKCARVQFDVPVAIRPLKDGVIADFEVTQEMIKYFIRKVHSRRSLLHPRIVIGIPSGITEVERRAVQEANNGKGTRFDPEVVEAFIEVLAAQGGAW